MNISPSMVSNALLQLLSAAQPQSSGGGQASSSDESSGVKAAGDGRQRAVDFSGQAGAVNGSPATSSLSSASQGNSLSSGGTTGSDDSQADLKQLLIEILQQLLSFLNPSKGSDNSTSDAGSSDGTSGSSAAPADAQAVPQSLAAQQPAPAAGASTDTGGGSSTGGGSASASTPAAAATSGVSGTSTDAGATGTSGLHLPDALKPFEADIQNAAEKTGMPANVIAGQIWAESRGNLSAATVNGGNGQADSGLMQVNASTAQDMKSKNPSLFDSSDINSPKNNIMAGALYLKEQKESFGDMGAALRAYNSGPGNVNTSNLSDISKTGTGAAPYVDNVLNFAKIIGSGQGQLPA